jgi:citrate synthase
MTWKTKLTKIEEEREYIRGYALSDLATKCSFVETIFLLWKGKLPTSAETKMLNALFTVSIDHGVGAPSTTVARTVASTGNSLHTALAAGITALGELHGGAIENAAQFFDAYATIREDSPSTPSSKEGDIANLVKKLLAQKIRFPGYGHKVLRHDHRSDMLFAIAKETGFYGKHSVFAQAVEKELNATAKKALPLNIDGAMAAIILDMGFDATLAKGFFLVGRTPGLIAHIYEEKISKEGVRRIPESDIEYTGEKNKKL